MPLRRTQIEVPLSLGLGQKADVRSLDAQGAVVMENCVHLKDGAIRKRFGHTFLPKTTLQALGGGLVTQRVVAAGEYQGAPLLFSTPNADAGALLAWSQTANAWSRQGNAPEIGVLDRIAVAGSSSQIQDVAIEYTGGYWIVAYTTDALVHAVVIDAATNTVALPAQSFGNSGSYGVRLVGNLTAGVVVLLYGFGATIQTATLATGVAPLAWTDNFGAPIIVDADIVTSQTGIFDAVPVRSDPTRFAVAYPRNLGATTAACVKTFSVALAQLSTRDSVARAIPFIDNIAVVSDSGVAHWVAYSLPGNFVYGFAVTDPGNVLQTEVALWAIAVGGQGRITMGRVSASQVTVLGDAVLTTPSLTVPPICTSVINAQRITFAAGATVAIGAVTTMPSLVLAGAPFTEPTTLTGNGRTYLPVAVPSVVQGTQFLIALDWWGHDNGIVPARAVATFAPRLWKSMPKLGNGTAGTTALCLARPAVNGTTYGIPVFVSTSLSHQGIAIERVDLTVTARFGGAQLGGDMAFATGCPTVYDGAGTFEAGFQHYPEALAPGVVGAGGAIAPGTYSYVFVYEMYDGQGLVGWSAPSPPVTVVVPGATTTVTFTNLPMLGLSVCAPTTLFGSLPYGVFIVPYRTTNGGTIYYRAVADPAPAALSATAGAVTWADTQSDATLTSNPQVQLIYTTGGVLANYCPPSARVCISHMNRWWLAGCDEPSQLWPSQAFGTGQRPGFNEAMAIQCTGAIRALASMDGNLVVFVERNGNAPGIEYITGQGPTNLGTQSDWSPPQPIPSDVGAIDQRSVCVTPLGVMFLSRVGGPNGTGGIFMLGRDLSVKYLSKGVEDTLAANPVVTSMLVHPNNGRVYVTCVPTDSGFTSGVRLVWDYLQGGVWSSDVMPDADTEQTAAGAKSACVALGPTGYAYYWVTPAGRVYRETNGVGANSYYDVQATATSWVTMTYQSAWLKPSLDGFARFWGVQIQGDSLDPSNLSVGLTFDYAPFSYYAEGAQWTAAQQAAFDRFPQVDVQLTPGNQKAKAIQIALQDAPPTGGPVATTGQGPSWATIALSVGVDDSGRGNRNLPGGQRA